MNEPATPSAPGSKGSATPPGPKGPKGAPGPDDDEPIGRGFPGGLIIAGAALAVIGLVVHMESSSVRWADGKLVEASFKDPVAIGAGLGALVVAAVALLTFRAVRPAQRTLHVVAAIAIAAVGGYHAARGFGLFFHPSGPAPVAGGSGPATPPVPVAGAAGADAATATAPADPAADRRDEQRALCEVNPAACPEYRALLVHDCDAGDVAACTDLSVVLVKGVGGDQDAVAARAAAQKSCDGHSAQGCANLAFLAGNGQGGAADPALARRAATEACEAGNAQGCGNLAVLASADKLGAGPEDTEVLLDLACAHYDDHGCIVLADGLQAMTSRSRVEDQRYRTTLLRMCQLAYERACMGLAELADAGIGGDRDPELAARARARACRHDEPAGCAEGETAPPRPRVEVSWLDPQDGGDHLDWLDVVEANVEPCLADAGGDAIQLALHVRPGQYEYLWSADAPYGDCLGKQVASLKLDATAETTVRITLRPLPPPAPPQATPPAKSAP